MKKAVFVTIIDAIEEQDKLDRFTGQSITKLGDPEMTVNNRFVFTTPLITTLLDALKHEFDDKFDWISYYIYELDYGKKSSDMKVRLLDNNTEIELSSPAILYDFMINEK